MTSIHRSMGQLQAYQRDLSQAIKDTENTISKSSYKADENVIVLNTALRTVHIGINKIIKANEGKDRVKIDFNSQAKMYGALKRAATDALILGKKIGHGGMLEPQLGAAMRTVKEGLPVVTDITKEKQSSVSQTSTPESTTIPTSLLLSVQATAEKCMFDVGALRYPSTRGSEDERLVKLGNDLSSLSHALAYVRDRSTVSKTRKEVTIKKDLAGLLLNKANRVGWYLKNNKEALLQAGLTEDQWNDAYNLAFKLDNVMNLPTSQTLLGA